MLWWENSNTTSFAYTQKKDNLFDQPRGRTQPWNRSKNQEIFYAISTNHSAWHIVRKSQRLTCPPCADEEALFSRFDTPASWFLTNHNSRFKHSARIRKSGKPIILLDYSLIVVYLSINRYSLGKPGNPVLTDQPNSVFTFRPVTSLLAR